MTAMRVRSDQKAFEGWVKVSCLAFAPGVALAYDHGWGGPALRGIGVGIAILCAMAGLIWVGATNGKPGG